MSNQTLPCGCRRGYQLCALAEHLWRLTTIRYQASALDNYSDATWRRYKRALEDYNAHFDQPPA